MRGKKELIYCFILIMFSTLFTGCVHEIKMCPPQKEYFKKEVGYCGEKELTIFCKTDVSNLKIVSLGKDKSDKLFRVEVIYDKTTQRLNYDYSNSKLNLSLETKGNKCSMSKNSRMNVTLYLTDKIPINFDLKISVGDGDIDLTGLKVKSIKLRNGTGSVNISCKVPNKILCKNLLVKDSVGDINIKDVGNLNCKNLKLIEGTGNCYIWVDGEWKGALNGKIKEGVGDVEAVFDKFTGVKLNIKTGGITSNIELPRNYFFTNGNGEFVSKNFTKVTKRAFFEINCGIGHVKVKIE